MGLKDHDKHIKNNTIQILQVHVEKKSKNSQKYFAFFIGKHDLASRNKATET
jgi:hypothetical protein